MHEHLVEVAYYIRDPCDLLNFLSTCRELHLLKKQIRFGASPIMYEYFNDIINDPVYNEAQHKKYLRTKYIESKNLCKYFVRTCPINIYPSDYWSMETYYLAGCPGQSDQMMYRDMHALLEICETYHVSVNHPFAKIVRSGHDNRDADNRDDLSDHLDIIIKYKLCDKQLKYLRDIDSVNKYLAIYPTVKLSYLVDVTHDIPSAVVDYVYARINEHDIVDGPSVHFKPVDNYNDRAISLYAKMTGKKEYGYDLLERHTTRCPETYKCCTEYIDCRMLDHDLTQLLYIYARQDNLDAVNLILKEFVCRSMYIGPKMIARLGHRKKYGKTINEYFKDKTMMTLFPRSGVNDYIKIVIKFSVIVALFFVAKWFIAD